jgi:hypothetical protein
MGADGARGRTISLSQTGASLFAGQSIAAVKPPVYGCSD